MKLKTVLLIFILTFLISGCAGNDELHFSGIIEGKEVRIFSQVSGEVVSILKDEGDLIGPKDQLAAIDDQLFMWQVKEAESAAKAALAKYEGALAGTRQGDMDKGVAQVHQATAAVLQSRARLEQTEAALKAMAAQVEQIKSSLQGANETYSFHRKQLQDMELLYEEGALTGRELENQRELLNKALTQVNNLSSQYDAAIAQLEGIGNEYDAAKAGLAGAEAHEKGTLGQLSLLEEGATAHDLQYLMALREQSDARVEQAKVMLANTLIYSPIEGVILRKHMELGELVKPGAVLYTILEPQQLEITMYVPQEDLGKVVIGKQVHVQVDAYPNQKFLGEIVHISERAEFTPRNIQTSKERSKMVFAVNVKLKEGYDELKPGMVADLYLPLDVKGGN